MSSNGERTTDVVLAADHGYARLRPAVRAGQLARLRRGAYLAAEGSAAGVGATSARARRERELWARCHAVAASLSCHFAFSHTTAAFLLGLPAPVEAVVHVLQTVRPTQRRSLDIVRHHTTDLDEDDVVHVDGLPVTSTSRTALDCALAAHPLTGLAVVDAALRSAAAMTRFEREQSSARGEAVREQWRLALAQRSRARNSRRARAVLTHADGFSESGGESWMRWMVLSRGAPTPRLQACVPTAQGEMYPDALWTFDDRTVLAEYDGMGKYDDAGVAVVAQTDREQSLVDATGGRVVRFTRHDMRAPDAAFARLARTFSDSTRRSMSPRPDLRGAYPSVRG